MIWHVEKWRGRGLRHSRRGRIPNAAGDIGIYIVEKVARVDAERDVVAAIRVPAAKRSAGASRKRASRPAASSTASPPSSSATTTGSALLPARARFFTKSERLAQANVERESGWTRQEIDGNRRRV